MTDNTQKPVETLSYEQAFAELESIVETLEREEHTLEAALALYARGQALLRHCRRLLEEAEMKVQRLVDGKITPLDTDVA